MIVGFSGSFPFPIIVFLYNSKYSKIYQNGNGIRHLKYAKIIAPPRKTHCCHLNELCRRYNVARWVALVTSTIIYPNLHNHNTQIVNFIKFRLVLQTLQMSKLLHMHERDISKFV